MTAVARIASNTALQLTGDSAFHSTHGRVWHWNFGAPADPKRRAGS
jgi:hypothetical protein